MKHEAPPPSTCRVIHSRPPASVWELSHARQQLAPWPPKFEGGRIYSRLGPWNAPDPMEGGAAA